MLAGLTKTFASTRRSLSNLLPEEIVMNKSKSVVLTLLASGAFVGLTAVSFSSYAGTHIGRHTDQPQPARTTGAEASGKTYGSGAVYVGRRIDNAQATLARRPAEQAELAAFEAGQPGAATRGTYTGRRSDSLR